MPGFGDTNRDQTQTSAADWKRKIKSKCLFTRNVTRWPLVSYWLVCQFVCVCMQRAHTAYFRMSKQHLMLCSCDIRSLFENIYEYFYDSEGLLQHYNGKHKQILSQSVRYAKYFQIFKIWYNKNNGQMAFKTFAAATENRCDCVAEMWVSSIYTAIQCYNWNVAQLHPCAWFIVCLNVADWSKPVILFFCAVFSFIC